MIPIGRFKQPANPILVFFVFSCILITTVFLIVDQRSEAKAKVLTSVNNHDYYSGPDDF